MDNLSKNLKNDEKKPKKVLALYPFNQKFPVVYDSTIDMFSKRYNLIYSPPKWSKFYWLKDNNIIRNSYYFIMNIIKEIKRNNKKIKGDKNELSLKNTLLFCFNQLPPSGFDFIIDLETVLGIVGYDYLKLDETAKKYISDRLASNKCKAINCWNRYAYLDLIKLIDCSRFEHKINIIHFAGRNIKIEKRPKKTLNFLFVASVNNPVAFRTKGGFIALEAYAQLAKKYNNIKFFVRANINKKLAREYRKIPGIVLLTKYLRDEEMNKLFAYSDILLEPFPGMDLMMKSMEFGIPVIAFDYECAYETIFDKKTGFLIDSKPIFGDRSKLDEYCRNQNKNYQKLFDQKKCVKFSSEFVKKCEILIKNKKFLEEMSKRQHSLIEKNGKYSLEKRNKNLIKMIDPHMK